MGFIKKWLDSSKKYEKEKIAYLEEKQKGTEEASLKYEKILKDYSEKVEETKKLWASRPELFIAPSIEEGKVQYVLNEVKISYSPPLNTAHFFGRSLTTDERNGKVNVKFNKIMWAKDEVTLRKNLKTLGGYSAPLIQRSLNGVLKWKEYENAQSRN